MLFFFFFFLEGINLLTTRTVGICIHITFVSDTCYQTHTLFAHAQTVSLSGVISLSLQKRKIVSVHKISLNEELNGNRSNLGITSMVPFIYTFHVTEFIYSRVYQILQVLEFSSYRKRMSAIVRTMENQILLLCKGADRFGS